MKKEGQELSVQDLSPVRAKKLKTTYHQSFYRLKLKGKKSRIRIWLPICGLLALLLILFLNSRPFKELALIYKIREKNILVGFQNSAELRPTGGFWGSFGILTIDKNFSANLRFDTNPYKKDNPLFQKSTIELPKPLKETWPDRNQSFVNANYLVDFSETAKSLQWFLNEGWNEQTDGVVGISSLAVIDLLKMTGPIEVDGVTINSDNFSQILSDKIERDYWKDEQNKLANEPKTILKDMAPLLIEKTKRISLLKLYRFFNQQIETGRIIAYFNQNDNQRLVENLGMDDKVKTANMDYLNINNANLDGDKTSLNVSQSISYEITGSQKPTAILQITRSQTPSWPDKTNKNYTRVLVPLGCKLLSASLDGEDIFNSVETGEEAGKTFFGFWFSVEPGNSRTADLEYELPFEKNNLSNYNLVWQKQPGTLEDKIEIKNAGKLLYSGKFNKNYLKIGL